MIDDRTVIIRDLKPITLMSADDYTPPLTNRGEHVLKFASPEGMSPVPSLVNPANQGSKYRCRRFLGSNGSPGGEILAQLRCRTLGFWQRLVPSSLGYD